MELHHQRVVLVTGASSGIGQACAGYLHQKGYRVYGTSRRAKRFPGEPVAVADQTGTFHLIPMDVTSGESVAQAIQWIVAREGRIDVVVNNAGYGLAGAVEDTELGEARAQLETNFFGVVRVCKAVLPAMREQAGGYLVNISSIGGFVGIPFQGFYSASKFALEGLTESLRIEVKSYGIRVVLIEPGDFNTNLTVNRRRAKGAGPGSAYLSEFTQALGVMEADEINGPAPERIGVLLERIITTKSPRLRYITGPASEKLTGSLKKIMPPGMFEWMLMRHFKLK
jgi:NAD(P)-dependent dehydrogenase (short-subunit alcohol dehydrogenase family)